MSGRIQLMAAACLVAALAVACGGKTSSQPGGIGESGAALVRSEALAYVAVDSDLGSGQWQQVDELLKKFPVRDRFLSELKKSLAEQKIDYERDVKPALGPELDIAAVAGASGQDFSYAAMTKPDSIEKAKELVQKLDQSSPPASATRVVDGWLIVSDKQEMIDAVLRGSGSSLADATAFKDAFGQIPDDALLKVYANGPQVAKLIGLLSSGGFQPAAAGGTSPLGNLDWAAAAAVAEDNGLKLEGDAKTSDGSTVGGAPYASKLISGVPADAFFFSTFHGQNAQDQLRTLRQNPAFGGALGLLEQQVGIRLEDVLGLFEHETAFYVRRGPGLPEFSLVFEAPNTEQALGTVDRLAARLATVTHARLGAEQQGGLDVKTLNFGRVTVRWAGFDGRVLLTTAPTGVADYRASGDKLGDDSAFKDALGTAGAPDKTIGLTYVNLADSFELIKSYAGLAGTELPPAVRENLKPLRSFVVYGSAKGDVTKFAAFLEVK
jgi:Protein of unknown function (DUF3352)